MSLSEFMNRRAVDLRSVGRYQLASSHNTRGDRPEFTCQTTRISPFQMLVHAPVLGPPGERVISFFGEFGRLDGWITDVHQSGFLLDIALPKKDRDSLASKLIWLEKKQKKAVVDERRGCRIVPENPRTTLILEDGTIRECFVIDVSSSGVAVSADIVPAIGARLAVGCGVGHVVRHFNDGFAVHFDRVQSETDPEQTIRPPADVLVYRSGLRASVPCPYSPRPR